MGATDPVKIPMTLPLGRALGVRTPHPRCLVLKIWSGTSRGFCATRFGHIEPQLQFCGT
jgi:hypothetical protein